jgi:hypothetical protein
VVPEGNIHPEEGGLIRVTLQDFGHGPNVAYRLFSHSGCRAEEKRFSSGNNSSRALEKFEANCIWKGEALSHKALSDYQPIAKRKNPVDQSPEGFPIDTTLFV